MGDERGALARGLEVVDLLNARSGVTLEQIVMITGYPKTSLFRILRTLVEHRFAARDASGFYHPLVRIQPLTETMFEDRLQQTMHGLAEESGQTVEWYEPRDQGLVLTRRALPSGTEIGVQACIGFIREWNEELDAVLALGIAHLKPQTVEVDLKRLEAYCEPFKRTRISADFATSRIEDAKKTGCVYDTIPNSNNVRRAATLIRDAVRPAGVLAVAEVVHPEQSERIEELCELLSRNLLG